MDSDLGGFDNLPEAERALVRQAASLTLRAEQLQAAVVNGESVNADVLIKMSSEARRLLARIRKPKPGLTHGRLS